MPEENKPFLTGEEVSDEAHKLALQMADMHFHGNISSWKTCECERLIQALLSTARAQDKAALAELTELREQDRRVAKDNSELFNAKFLEIAEALLPGEDGPCDLAASAKSIRLEVVRLKTEVERQEANIRRNVAELTRGNDDRAEIATLRTRLAQAESNSPSIVSMPDSINLHNAGERCDALIGACSCGATHTIAEIPSRFESLLSVQQTALEIYIAKLDQTQNARDLAEQRVREMDGIEKAVSNELRECVRASSCPAGTDLAAWVGQLAEDKARKPIYCASCGNFINASDASNPKTE